VSQDPYRLPTTVRPDHYTITLDPDLSGDGFHGSVSIDAEVVETTDVVVLNADGLIISSARIVIDGGDPVECAVEIDAETERAALHPGAELAPGPLAIELTFAGSYNEQLVGLYLSRFDDDNGVSRALATTQFEATHARKCFPCWDEPAFKATFQLTLVIDPDHQAVSNSVEVSRTSNDEGRTVVSFAPTMLMSTYLVAFVVGPMEITPAVDVDGTPFRVVHVPGRGELTAFALEAGAFALRHFADYFALPYPGDKLDLVAIPDFGFGAMENLGCVTFREVALLVDPAKATQAELQRVADVINHEIAHMWFGDLVTMSWWNGLWLNEAFATFMEMRCTDAFRPEWDRWTDFGLSRTEALEVDALSATRPIEYEVVSPADAEGMFDVLTYEKGAAVVRMLEQYLGEERFRNGIRRYMAENQYGNAETTDLWDAIEAETGEPVRSIMDSWIFQGGFPLISFRADGSTITFSQEPMAYLGGDTGDEVVDGSGNGGSRPVWKAPIRYRCGPAGTNGSGEAAVDRLLLDEMSASIELASAPGWLVANTSGAGFFRVVYDDDQLDALAGVAMEAMEPIERYALVDDAFASVLAGRSTTPAFLNLIEALSGEENRSVWQRLISGLRQLDRLLDDGEAREVMQEVAHDVLAPPLANLGLAPRVGENERSRQLRGDLVLALGTVADDPEIQEESKRAVATARRNPELVEASLLAAAVEVVASIGDTADFEAFVDAWKQAATPQEELRYLFALAEFSDPALVARFHNLVLDGQIRTQNAPYLLGRSLGNRRSGAATWAFITGHWDRVNALFPTSSIVRMLAGLPALDRPDQAEAAATFFADHPVTTGAQTLRQLLEKQRVRVALRLREAERLQAFLLGSRS
jgi:puromycin-sensitive aminopeptidase